jgi:peptidyl-prolyl cis-trans isomerase D
MLKIMRRGSKLVLWVVIIGVGAVFVLYLGFQGGFAPAPGSGPVVRVGNISFEGRDLERVRLGMEARYRDALGDQFDAERARDMLVESAASALLRSGLLAWQGQRMGLTVSDAEIREYLRGAGLVDGEGKLDRDAITNYAEREFGSVRRFQERLRADLLADKTARLLRDSATLSDAELRDALRYQLEEVKIAAVKFDGRTLPANLEVPEEAAQALLAKDPERVRTSYESRRSEFDRPEQARARHVLVRFEAGDDAAKQEARKRIDALRERIVAGADFAEVAMQASEDDATRAKGGDLGWISRGAVVKPLEDAAFGQAPGALGEVIETAQGFHLVRVEERQPARVVPFEEAQLQVAQDLARVDAAVAAARAQAEEVSRAVAGGGSLVDVAREKGLTILRPDALRRRPDGYVPQLGVAHEVLTAAFTLSPEKPSDPTLHPAGENVFVLIELLERKTPTEEELAQGLPSLRERILEQRRAELESLWLSQLRQRLAEERELVYDLEAFRGRG